jgi:hypothetical protein
MLNALYGSNGKRANTIAENFEEFSLQIAKTFNFGRLQSYLKP